MRTPGTKKKQIRISLTAAQYYALERESAHRRLSQSALVGYLLERSYVRYFGEQIPNGVTFETVPPKPGFIPGRRAQNYDRPDRFQQPSWTGREKFNTTGSRDYLIGRAKPQ